MKEKNEFRNDDWLSKKLVNGNLIFTWVFLMIVVKRFWEDFYNRKKRRENFDQRKSEGKMNKEKNFLGK